MTDACPPPPLGWLLAPAPVDQAPGAEGGGHADGQRQGAGARDGGGDGGGVEGEGAAVEARRRHGHGHGGEGPGRVGKGSAGQRGRACVGVLSSVGSGRGVWEGEGTQAEEGLRGGLGGASAAQAGSGCGRRHRVQCGAGAGRAALSFPDLGPIRLPHNSIPLACAHLYRQKKKKHLYRQKKKKKFFVYMYSRPHRQQQ